MKKCLIVHPCLLLMSLACAMPAAGMTERFGVIDQSQRWTAEESPYLISDDILVTKNARLFIAPGVTVYIGKPHAYNPRIRQFDNLDSFSVAIRVEGVLTCAGRRDKRISIIGRDTDSAQCDWYGLVLDGVLGDESEISFTDMAGACHGLMVRKGAPLIHHCVFEYNNIGITIKDGSKARVINCIAAYNFATGVRVEKSNPVFWNNLLVFNRNNGLSSDGVSHITFEYNCVFGNPDGNLVGTDPELGIIKTGKKNKDTTDYAFNKAVNPVFAGTTAESLAVEKDYTLPTQKSRVKDTAVAMVMHKTLPDSIPFARPKSGVALRYVLSRYSPCRDAGKKGKAFNDDDGSRNDMGIHGGPEFFQLDK